MIDAFNFDPSQWSNWAPTVPQLYFRLRSTWPGYAEIELTHENPHTSRFLKVCMTFSPHMRSPCYQDEGYESSETTGTVTARPRLLHYQISCLVLAYAVNDSA
jgi:hypothetical protein